MKIIAKTVIVALLFSTAITLAGCDRSGKLPAGVITMAELKAQGKSPIEIINASASSGVGNVATGTNPTVEIEFKNISDKNISLINWTIVNINANGKLCANSSEESGFAEVGGIAPGETFTGSSFSSDPQTSDVVVIIKDLAYDDKVSDYEISMKWENPDYDTELAAVKNEHK